MATKLEQVINQQEADKNRSCRSQTPTRNYSVLRWLGNHNFTFMGYKEFDLVEKMAIPN